MLVKVRSKERIGREPLRQLPGKWSSDMVWTESRPGVGGEVVSGGGTVGGRWGGGGANGFGGAF